MEIPADLYSCILGILAVLCAGHGLPLLGAALRSREARGSPLLLARGARAVIASAALAVIAAGVSVDSRGLLWFGIAFLAEEIYETGVVILILRWGAKRGLV